MNPAGSLSSPHVRTPIEVRRPVVSTFSRGRLESLTTGKPLVELKAPDVVATRDTQGILINGLWFVPAAAGETYVLNRLWQEAHA